MYMLGPQAVAPVTFAGTSARFIDGCSMGDVHEKHHRPPCMSAVLHGTPGIVSNRKHSTARFSREGASCTSTNKTQTSIEYQDSQIVPSIV